MHERHSPTFVSRLAGRRRLPRAALLAIAAFAVALPAGIAATTPGRAADTTPTTRAAATAPVERSPQSTPRAVAGHGASLKNKKSVTVRIRLGQTLSMATLTVLDPATVGTPPSAGKQDDWSLVTSPADTGLTAPPPGAATFTPDVPGTYVFQSKPGKGGGADAAQRTLNVQAEPVERLVCVNTRVWPSGSDPGSAPEMTVGSHQPFTGGSNMLQVVVLERATTGLPSPDSKIPASKTFPETDQGYADYKTFLTQTPLTNAYLVLVSGSVSSASMQSVWGPLARLGAADLPSPFPSTPVPFSFIGIPGLGKGDGWQAVDGSATTPVRSACDPDVTGEPTNNLSGWLTLDSTGSNYTYVAGDDVSVDTAPAAAPGHHAIQVGNQTYTIPLGHDHGWHVLLLERESLCPEWAAADACTPPAALLNAGYGQDGSGFTDMDNALAPYVADPDALLILAPFAADNSWMQNANPSPVLVDHLRDFGGSILAPGRAFEDASSRYALIGGGDRSGLPVGSAAPEIVESFTGFGADGHITGYLTRDHQNRFGASDTGLGGEAPQGLHALAYAPPTPWPADTGSKAFSFLSGKIGYPVSPTSAPLGVRGAYSELVSWPDVLADLLQFKDWSALSPAEQQAAGSDEAQYDAVYKELHDEIEETSNLHAFVTNLQAVYTGSTVYDLGPVKTRVVDEIDKTLTPPKAKSTLWLELTHAFLGIASAIPEIGEVFDVAGEVLDAGLAVARDANGEPQDVRGQVFDSAQQMQDEALAFLGASSEALNHLGAIVASDPVKLAVVGKKAGPVGDVNSSDDEHPWAISGDQLNALQTSVTQGLTRWLMPSVVNAGFKVWQVRIPGSETNIDGSHLNEADATPFTYRCKSVNNIAPDEITHPFGDVPNPDGWIKLDNGTQTYSLALGGTRYSADDLEEHSHHAPPPSQELLDTLYGAAPTGLALNKAWLFEQGLGETIGTDKFMVDC
jgi:hypothetical protein